MEVRYKKPVLRIVIEVRELDRQMLEIGGIETVKDEAGKETTQPVGIFGIFGDGAKSEKYAPIWKKFCQAVLENPEEYSDFFTLTGEEVLDIREGFFEAAHPLKRRLAALKDSEVSTPRAN